jgi:CheY-like chemotaxis protein
MAASEQPDLILMDLNLPKVDGWEAARRLKADPATCDIPIIGLRPREGARHRLRRFRHQARRVRPPACQDRTGPHQ